MHLLSRRYAPFCILLLWFSATAWADVQDGQALQEDVCYFYKYMKGTESYSDPANHVISYIKKRWIELENDLAKGHGEELSYLQGLAKCPYRLPIKFWESNLKGLPYEQRAVIFTDHFMSQCFCEW